MLYSWTCHSVDLRSMPASRDLCQQTADSLPPPASKVDFSTKQVWAEARCNNSRLQTKRHTRLTVEGMWYLQQAPGGMQLAMMCAQVQAWFCCDLLCKWRCTHVYEMQKARPTVLTCRSQSSHDWYDAYSLLLKASGMGAADRNEPNRLVQARLVNRTCSVGCALLALQHRSDLL